MSQPQHAPYSYLTSEKWSACLRLGWSMQREKSLIYIFILLRIYPHLILCKKSAGAGISRRNARDRLVCHRDYLALQVCGSVRLANQTSPISRVLAWRRDAVVWAWRQFASAPPSISKIARRVLLFSRASEEKYPYISRVFSRRAWAKMSE